MTAVSSSSASRRAARVLMPSLGKILCRWSPTVLGDTNSFSPICLLVSPEAARLAISRSRGLRVFPFPPVRASPQARSSLPARAVHGAAPSRSNTSKAALSSMLALVLARDLRRCSP